MKTLVNSIVNSHLAVIYAKPGIGVKTFLKSVMSLLGNVNNKLCFYEDLTSFENLSSDCDIWFLYYKKPIKENIFNEIQALSLKYNKIIIVGIQIMSKDRDNVLPIYEKADILIRLSRKSISDISQEDYNITKCEVISNFREPQIMFLEYDEKLHIFKNKN